MPTTEQLDGWWARTPDANVALVLGRGRFAVDLDGGVDAEALLAEQGIALPVDAPRSKTGGGFHVFLSSLNAIPDRVGLLTTDGGKPQVDIRGVGIVVVPPSIHPNGSRYEWLTPLAATLPRAPLPLCDLIGRTAAAATPPPAGATEPTGHRFWVADALRGVGEGQRDHVCTRLAGYFLTRGLDADTTIAILCDTFARSCTPPFPVRDVEKCVRSIARRQALSSDAPVGLLPRHISQVLPEFVARLDSGPGEMLPTPFPTLNHFLDGGLSPGQLVFLGARPGAGKTALSLEMARSVAKSGKGAVLLVSREMTNLALVRRLVSQDSRVRASVIKRATLSASDLGGVLRSIERLTDLPLFLTDEAVSLADIVALVSGIVTERSLALVVVDYLQLVRAPRDVKERRHQVEAVSQGLKALALQFQVPVLCLSSLSRGSGDDRNKPPTLSSLRESGELEHDADIILLLHREYQHADTTCYVAKNRDGRTGQFTLVFHADFLAFNELETAYADTSSLLDGVN